MAPFLHPQTYARGADRWRTYNSRWETGQPAWPSQDTTCELAILNAICFDIVDRHHRTGTVVVLNTLKDIVRAGV